MKKGSLAAIVCLVLFTALTTTSSAQNCGFPWTLTAAPAGGQSVAITVCGLYTGCHPHDPQFTIVGSQINLTLQSSEPPDRCQCIAVEGTFQQTFFVHPLTPGTYTVTATLLSCGPPQPSGSTSFTFDATSAIPALDARGLATLAALILAIGLWRIRR
jgi:hypothetical protein